MQKRANSARAGSLSRRLVGWVFGVTFAWMSAARLTRAFDVKCGVETVAQVNVESAQNGRQRTSAMVSACRTGRVNEQGLQDICHQPLV
jgi:hypothetical protein